MSKKAALIWAAAVLTAVAVVVFAYSAGSNKYETTQVSEQRFRELAVRAHGTKVDTLDAARAVCVGLNLSGHDSYDQQTVPLVVANFSSDEIDQYFSYPINTYCPEFAK